ncbi:hypothetical protein LTR53_013582 [Teratosphaeriaceae sp. CCFEE 6253]|nr:hypothetical protein LTR53_013582 [Teratosphaeriaceae sp. CCFEE 6253]
MAGGLSLAEAHRDDLDAMKPLFFLAFHDETFYRELISDTPQARDAFRRATELAMNDPYTKVLKVTENGSDVIVAMGRWIAPRAEDSETQPGTNPGRWGDFPRYCNMQLASALFGSFARKRQEMMGSRKHYYMELLVTAEGNKGRGAGTMILQYGCSLADQEKVECYIDSSPAGKPLYEKFGWVFTREEVMPRFEELQYKQHFGIRQPVEQ